MDRRSFLKRAGAAGLAVVAAPLFIPSERLEFGLPRPIVRDARWILGIDPAYPEADRWGFVSWKVVYAAKPLWVVQVPPNGGVAYGGLGGIGIDGSVLSDLQCVNAGDRPATVAVYRDRIDVDGSGVVITTRGYDLERGVPVSRIERG